MLNKIRARLKKNIWHNLVAFILLFAFVYGFFWTAVEPWNLDIITGNKRVWRIILFTTTFGITLFVYIVLLIESDSETTLFFHRIRTFISHRYLSSKKGYIADLKKTFNLMPFIYSGADMSESLTIENNHVAASYGYYPLEPWYKDKLQFYRDSVLNDEFSNIMQGCANSMLDQCSRIVIFGHAGMGKTTFIQHSTLKIIGKKTDFYEFNPFFQKEGLIPIYIPLKVLGNEIISPILKYLNTIPFFKGEKGFKRLIELAGKGKIILFLDGYDEIKTNSNSKNTILEELDILFSRQPFANPEKNELFKQAYRLLTTFNSIWLTSRLSFFFDFPLEFLKNHNEILRNSHFYENYTEQKLNDINKSEVVGSIIIKGVQEKHKLISKLVDLYKENDPTKYYSLTSSKVFEFFEENFEANKQVNEVDNSPLFLTIFFYIYIRAFFPSNITTKQKISLKSAIELCTELIFNDVDQQKIRGLSSSGIHQRIKYDSNVKKEFVQFFSYQFYINPFFQTKSSFTIEDLFEVADDFKAISLSMKLEDKKKLVSEILAQNFFIMIAGMGDKKYYDFPHRRFKEFFAIDYFNSNENFLILLEHLRDGNFRDFLVVYYLHSEKNNERLIEEIINQIIRSGDTEGLDGLLNECLSYKKFDIPNLLIEKLLSSLIFEIRIKSLSGDVLNCYRLTVDLTNRIEIEIRECIHSDDVYNIQRLCNIYFSLSPGKTMDFISSQIGIIPIQGSINQLFCSFLLKSYPEESVSKIFSRQFDNENFASLLSYLGSTDEFKKKPELWKFFFKYLSTRQNDQFKTYISKELEKQENFSVVSGIFCTLLIDKYPENISYSLLQKIFKKRNFSELVVFMNSIPRFKNNDDDWINFSGYLSEVQLKILKKKIRINKDWP